MGFAGPGHFQQAGKFQRADRCGATAPIVTPPRRWSARCAYLLIKYILHKHYFLDLWKYGTKRGPNPLKTLGGAGKITVEFVAVLSESGPSAIPRRAL